MTKISDLSSIIISIIIIFIFLFTLYIPVPNVMMARSAPLQAFITDDELYELVRRYIILYYDSSQQELFATLVFLLPLIFFHLNFLLLSFNATH